MARASTLTKLPLDRFFFHIGLDPLHGSQVYFSTTALCPEPLKQFSWQNHSATSREDIAIAIRQAESDLERWLKFPLLPTWYEGEVAQVARPADPNLFNARGLNVRGLGKTVRLSHGHVLYGGRRLKTLVEAAVLITYSDLDGDGYDETATITTTVPVALTALACAVHLYYPGLNGDDRYEIRPLNSIDLDPATGLITATFRREQAVLLTLTDDPIIPEPIDGTLDANFLEDCDAYLVVNDPSQQGQMEWVGEQGCGCGAVGCLTCQVGVQSACMTTVDAAMGIVRFTPATWDSGTELFTANPLGMFLEPDRIRINYRAGFQWAPPQSIAGDPACQLLQMDPEWERLVSILAASRLDRRLCTCDTLEAYMQRWREPMENLAEGDWPLGTTHGEVLVWKSIRERLGT